MCFALQSHYIRYWYYDQSGSPLDRECAVPNSGQVHGLAPNRPHPDRHYQAACLHACCRPAACPP